MKILLSSRAAIVAISAVVFLPQALAAAAEWIEPATQVVVRLRDGRRPEGRLVPTPDAGLLRLRTDADGVSVESTFDRRNVVAVIPKSNDSGTPAVEIPSPSPARRTAANAEAKPTPPVGRIQSLEIEAAPGNWDRDAEPDGLLIRLIPIADRAGGQAAVSGELTITLLAYVRDSYETDSLALITRPREIERTSCVVRATDFTDGTAVYRLPYRRNDPSRDPAIEPYCRVHARLGVPTQGVFEADAPVQLRASDPSFDRLPYFETLRP